MRRQPRPRRRREPSQPPRGIGALLDEAEVVICAGSGGVGKTTISAALGVAAARRGLRTAVVTIDPARRLADSLGCGVEGLADSPSRIDGAWPGELWASMLDSRAMFDTLVRRNATPEQAERILANRFYRNVAEALSGTQEYMAAEKLHELHGDERFDLVVVDTPPTRNALDFLDAPATLVRFLEHPLYRLLMAPTRRMTRTMSAAASAFLKAVSTVVGAPVVEDAVEFFRSFAGLEEGFRQRAHEVAALFSDERTAFVLVTSPRRDALDEARWFAAALDPPVRAVVVNRVQPLLLQGPLDRLRLLSERHPGSELDLLCRALVEHREAADLERSQLAEVIDELGVAPVVLVPLQTSDVHDLAGLEEIAELLIEGGEP